MNIYDQGVILKYNVDENGMPTSWHIPNEIQQVNPMNNLIQLVQIPDELQKMHIWDYDGNKLQEVYDIEEVGVNNFKVDYNSGLVRLHSSLGGQEVIISYYGRGVELVSTTRVYHKGEQGTMDVLYDVLEDAKEAMEVVDTLGGVAETIGKLDEMIDKGEETVKRIEDFVQELEAYGYTIALSREAFVVKADENGEIGKMELASVYSDIIVYKGGKQIVPVITLSEHENCEFRVENQRVKLYSLDVNTIKASVIVNIDCGENLIVKRKLEITKVFDGKELYDIDMTNPIWGVMSNFDGEIVDEQSIECEISATKADTDYTHYTLSVQRLPLGMEYSINKSSVVFRTKVGKTLPDSGSLLVVVTLDGKSYPKTFAWNKIKSGEGYKSLVLSGSQIMKYNTHDYSDIPTPYKITVNCNTVGLTGTPKWYAKHDGEYTLIDGEFEPSLVIYHDNQNIWNNQLETTIKCEIDGFYDEISIVKIANGQQGNDAFSVVLSNETHTVSVSNDGTVDITEVEKVYSNVYAFLGKESVTPTIAKENVVGCDIEIVGNRIQLVSLDNSFSTATATVNVSYNGMSVQKVMTIAKAKQGSNGEIGLPANQYVLNITNGTRSFTYSQINQKPRPSVSSTFIASLYENGNEVLDVNGVTYFWTGRGHIGGNSVTNTFTPSIRATFDESITNNDIVIVASYKGNSITQVVPISITKDADGLDWVSEWDGTKAEIKGNKVLTPKLFAGEYNQDVDLLTGVAIGQDVLSDGRTTGIVGYQNNEVTYLFDTDGSIMVGSPFETGRNGMYYNGNQFVLKADQIAIGGADVPTFDDVIDYVGGNVDGLNESLNQINSQLQQDITDVALKVNNLEEEMNNSLVDGVLDEIEKAKLTALFESLRNEVKDVDAQYSSIVNNPFLTNIPVKEQLTLDYNEYKKSFGELESIFTVIINTSPIPSTANEDFNNAMTSFKSKSSIFAKMLNLSIMSISDVLTQNDIVTAKEFLNSELNDIVNINNELLNEITIAHNEGIVSLVQVKKIKSALSKLEKESIDLQDQHDNIYNNSKLGKDTKQSLANKKGQVDLCYENIVAKSNSIIVDYIISNKEMEEFTLLHNEYSASINSFKEIGYKSIEEIAKNTSQQIVDSFNQEDVFNKLTNNGQIQGMFMKDGLMYFNGEYIQTRNLKSVRDDGVETLKVDSDGEFHIKAKTFSLTDGSTIDSIAQDKVDSQTQNDVFNKLTNNGIEQGIYLQDGKIYVNGEYLKANSIDGNNIKANSISTETFDLATKKFIEDKYTKTETDTRIEAKAGEVAIEVSKKEIANINTGTRNIIKNGNFENGLNNWAIGEWQGHQYDVGVWDSGEWVLPNKKQLTLNVHSLQENPNGTITDVSALQSFNTIPNQWYSVSLYVSGHRAQHRVQVQKNVSDGAYIVKDVSEIGGGSNIENWNYVTLTFKAETTQSTLWLMINRCYGTNAYLWATDVCIVEGKTPAKFTPNIDEYSTINEMNAAINVKADEINLGVNKTFESYSTTEQMNSAIEINANEIKQSVSETYATINNVNNNFTTKSEFNQTSTSIIAKFNESVSCGNLIANGDFTNGRDTWSTWGDTHYFQESTPNCVEGVRLGSNTVGGYVSSKFRIKPYTNYTIAFSGHIEANVIGAYCSLELYDGNNTNRGTIGDIWLTYDSTRHVVHINTGAIGHDWTACFLLKHEGSRVQYSGYLAILNLICVTEGHNNGNYVPSTKTLYEGITRIDKDGITVTHSADSSSSNMSANGFMHNVGGTDRKYHSLAYMGFVSGGSWGTFNGIIQLPNEFKGKTVNVLASVVKMDFPHDIGDVLKSMVISTTDFNVANGTFRLSFDVSALRVQTISGQINGLIDVAYIAIA